MSVNDGSEKAIALMSRAVGVLVPAAVGGVVLFWAFASLDTFVGIPNPARRVLLGLIMAPWALLFLLLIPYSAVRGISWFRSAPQAESSATVRTMRGVFLSLIVVAMILSGAFDPLFDRIVGFLNTVRTSLFG